MDQLDEISRKRRKAHQKLLDLKSKVYASFLEMERAAYADGALPKKAKELIAIGISVQMDCESCMQWHIDQAVACGATSQEILEAIEVGIEMGAGRVTVSARFALDVMDRAFAQNQTPQSTIPAVTPPASVSSTSFAKATEVEKGTAGRGQETRQA